MCPAHDAMSPQLALQREVAVPPQEAEPDDDLLRCRAELGAAYGKIANLEIALMTGRRIGTAVGILMATYKVSDEAAFDLLVTASQNTHNKLRDVADEVVRTGELNWVGPHSPTGRNASPN